MSWMSEFSAWLHNEGVSDAEWSQMDEETRSRLAKRFVADLEASMKRILIRQRKDPFAEPDGYDP